MRVRRRAWILSAAALLGLLAVVPWRALDPTSAAVAAAVRAAILTDITVVELPPGNTPGHVTAAAADELRERVARVLPSVYTGTLLSLKLDRLSAYVDAVQANESIGANTGAGISSFTALGWPVLGSHADVTGSYAVWLRDEHWQDGSLVVDSSEATYTFSAGLELINGSWLVSSWTDQQTN